MQMLIHDGSDAKWGRFRRLPLARRRQLIACVAMAPDASAWPGLAPVRPRRVRSKPRLGLRPRSAADSCPGLDQGYGASLPYFVATAQLSTYWPSPP